MHIVTPASALVSSQKVPRLPTRGQGGFWCNDAIILVLGMVCSSEYHSTDASSIVAVRNPGAWEFRGLPPGVGGQQVTFGSLVGGPGPQGDRSVVWGRGHLDPSGIDSRVWGGVPDVWTRGYTLSLHRKFGGGSVDPPGADYR
eukprot:1188600-Prorocentrum_minimum.AAC.5